MLISAICLLDEKNRSVLIHNKLVRKKKYQVLPITKYVCRSNTCPMCLSRAVLLYIASICRYIVEISSLNLLIVLKSHRDKLISNHFFLGTFIRIANIKFITYTSMYLSLFSFSDQISFAYTY